MTSHKTAEYAFRSLEEIEQRYFPRPDPDPDTHVPVHHGKALHLEELTARFRRQFETELANAVAELKLR
jgi:hypothetical protein